MYLGRRAILKQPLKRPQDCILISSAIVSRQHKLFSPPIVTAELLPSRQAVTPPSLREARKYFGFTSWFFQIFRRVTEWRVGQKGILFDPPVPSRCGRDGAAIIVSLLRRGLETFFGLAPTNARKAGASWKPQGLCFMFAQDGSPRASTPTMRLRRASLFRSPSVPAERALHGSRKACASCL